MLIHNHLQWALPLFPRAGLLVEQSQEGGIQVLPVRSPPALFFVIQ